MFVILGIQMILLGIVIMLENTIHKEEKKFTKKRLRSLFLVGCIFLQVVLISFLHGAGLPT